MKPLAKGHSRSRPLSNFPPRHQLKDFSPDKVVKAHETHSLNLDMSATCQGTLCQGNESSGRWSSSLGVRALSSV